MDEMSVTDGEVEAHGIEIATPITVPPPVTIRRDELVEAIVEAIRRGELRLRADGEVVRSVL